MCVIVCDHTCVSKITITHIRSCVNVHVCVKVRMCVLQIRVHVSKRMCVIVCMWVRSYVCNNVRVCVKVCMCVL